MSRASMIRTERQCSSAVPRARQKPSTPPQSKRSLVSSSSKLLNGENDSERVRVAVRLRPKNEEELSDLDFITCVELQPELRRLKLKKNNWSSEFYRFDEIFTGSSSQRRVYQAVAKPVVETVLNGYNGTVMAYGQTGTGKTYTVGQTGKEDPSERGLMVRAMEDILADVSPETDTVTVSYLQLYLESIQDLLAPERTNLAIIEDPRAGEVSLPGIEFVEIKSNGQFRELLQVGEANRHAANTRMNTQSSRSHAILMIHIQRPSKNRKEYAITSMSDCKNIDLLYQHAPLISKSKLLIVDLAGSERINKSGSEGHMLEEAKFINLSLTSLGKCINALAENSPHIPTRDSKLTRLLRDSFGGTSRTSLIVTIGPSLQHYSETASTIMFGQRAMKVVNTVKLKEELDYESLCRRLEDQIDFLTSEIDRQKKLRHDEKEEFEKRLIIRHISHSETEKSFSSKIEYMEKENTHLEFEVKRLMEEVRIQKRENSRMSEENSHLSLISKQNKEQHHLENSTFQKVLEDTTQMYENRLVELNRQHESEKSQFEKLEKQIGQLQQSLRETEELLQVQQKEKVELRLKIKELLLLNEEASVKLQFSKDSNNKLVEEMESLRQELAASQYKLLNEEMRRKQLEDEVLGSRKAFQYDSTNADVKRQCEVNKLNGSTQEERGSFPLSNSNMSREHTNAHKAAVQKMFEGVGIPGLIALLKSERADVRSHAVKVVANLATEDTNQEKIVQEGGLDALLVLLESSQDTSILRVAAGAIANLAMNGLNQSLITSKGGARLLASIAFRTNDSQTLRMIAGALANLCGNEKLHSKLKEDGGLNALMEIAKSGNSDVVAQVARGMANFAKCESKGSRKGRSLLIEDGALTWMVANSTGFSSPIQRHIELALCHFAQNWENTADLLSSGAVKELVRISQESAREDTQNLAKKALHSNQLLLAHK